MEFRHPYLPLTRADEQEMLEAIGLQHIDDLFSNIPHEFRLNRDLDICPPHTEHEVSKRVQELASKNVPMADGRAFIGAGVGIHYIPAVVTSLANRSEFVTAYTSYQPEVSQGMLQTLFEYQSLLAEILAIDVVNSSLYDMATAVGEAARMCARVVRRRSRFLVPGTMNPEHRAVLETYCRPAGMTVEAIEYDRKTGLMSISDLEGRLGEDVAGVYVENPSYLGFIESQVDEISRLAHEAGALLVAGVDILSLGLLRPPGEYGADIVVAEGQGLGSPPSFGGPLLGVFGCRMERRLVYQLPGRLVGMTRTVKEPYERGFVLTLSPREQHIRREKATSNICSNQALSAVTAAIYLSLLGPSGLQTVSEAIAYKSAYAARRLDSLAGVRAPAIGNAIWKEFVVTFTDGITVESVHQGLLERGLHGGKALHEEFPWLGESMLLSVTEVHSKEQIDRMAAAVGEIVGAGGD